MVWWHGMVHVWYGTVWYDIPLLAMLDNQSEPSFKQNKLQVLSETEMETQAYQLTSKGCFGQHTRYCGTLFSVICRQYTWHFAPTEIQNVPIKLLTLIRIASSPPNMMTLWKTSVQITALIPPCNVKATIVKCYRQINYINHMEE